MTGTPLSRGLDDLYGLFYFMHAQPWGDALWWREALLRPYADACPTGKVAACVIKDGQQSHAPVLGLRGMAAHTARARGISACTGGYHVCEYD